MCKCGVFPIKIIFERFKKQLPESLELLIPINEQIVHQQHRAWAYMRQASKTPRECIPGELKQFFTFSESLQPYFCGIGSKESVIEALTGSTICPKGEDLVIPFCISENIITGFLFYDRINKNQEYHPILPGGLAFSYAVLNADRRQRRLYLFENILAALELLADSYQRRGLLYPVAAHPLLDFESNFQWLPKRTLIVVVNKFIPTNYHHLLPFNPNIVGLHDSKRARFHRTPYQLICYYKASERLKRVIPTAYAIDANLAVYVNGHNWFFTTGGIALNANIKLKHVYIYKNQKHYSGQILFDQKSYPFSISQADGVQGLKDLCYQYGRFLFCSPKLEKHFFDVLEGLNPEAKREKIKRLGIHKKHVFLPRLHITTDDIYPWKLSTNRKEAGAILKTRYTVPRFGLSEFWTKGGVNQLLICAGICFLLGSCRTMTKKYTRPGLFIVNREKDYVLQILEACGVVKHNIENPWPHFWPVYFDKFDKNYVFPIYYPHCHIGTEEELFYNMLNSNDIVCDLRTDYFFPLWPAQIFEAVITNWCQYVLQHFTDRYLSFTKILTAFFEFFHIPYEKQYLFKSQLGVKFLQAPDTRIKTALWMLALYYQENKMLDDKVFIYDNKICHLQLDVLNKTLEQRGFRPVHLDPQTQEDMLQMPRYTMLFQTPATSLKYLLGVNFRCRTK